MDITENNFSKKYKYIKNRRLYKNIENYVSKSNGIPIQIIKFKDIENNPKF